MSDLDAQGRNALEVIMTMIGDMRYRSHRIEGTCARYFLLVDVSVLEKLCVSAHLNCDKVREHIRRNDCPEDAETKAISDDPQNAFTFFREEATDEPQIRNPSSGHPGPQHYSAQMMTSTREKRPSKSQSHHG